jgi:hypothetical protein
MDAGTVIFWAYFGFNGGILGVIAYLTFMTKRSKNWPTTSGQVKSSRISYDSGSDKTSGTPYVLYAFEVNGKKYKSSVINPGDVTLADNDAAARVVARYPTGTNVIVHYNPQNPEDAFLEPFSPASARVWWSVLIGGDVLITFAVIVYIIFKAFQGG